MIYTLAIIVSAIAAALSGIVAAVLYRKTRHNRHDDLRGCSTGDQGTPAEHRPAHA